MKYFALALCAISLSLPLMAADPEIPLSGGYNTQPRVAVYNGELYLFHYGYEYLKTAGATWSAPMTVPFGNIPERCGGLDAAIAFNGRLYVFGGCGTGHYVSMDVQGLWSPLKQIPNVSTGSFFGLAVYKGRLYAAWRAYGTNTSLFYSSMDTNENWSPNAHLSTGESDGTPAMAVMLADDGNEYLYAFWEDRYFDGRPQSMWYSSMGPSLTWGPSQRLNTPDYPLTTNFPAAASASSIFVAYKGGYNDDVLYKKLSTNKQWLPEVTTASDVTQLSPALAYFNGGMWLFYRDKYSPYRVRYQILY